MGLGVCPQQFRNRQHMNLNMQTSLLDLDKVTYCFLCFVVNDMAFVFF